MQHSQINEMTFERCFGINNVCDSVNLYISLSSIELQRGTEINCLKMRLTLIMLSVIVGMASAQFPQTFSSSRFRTFATVKPRPSILPARYRFTNNDDGRYNSQNDGRYIPDDSGRYVHVDEGYDGGYGDSGSRGGYYNGDNGNYKHVDGGRGTGSGYQADGFGRPKKVNNAGVFNTKPSVKPTASPTNYRNSGPPVHVGKHVPSVKYGNEGGWRIIRMEKSMEPPYHYLYETENRILAEEEGHIQSIGNNEEAMRAFGFYEYYGDDGEKYHVDYTADENGFIPKGDHIPQALQRAFAYLARSNRL